MNNGITPDYDDEIPVINKITIAARTPYEKTILLQRPKGKENRKKMAKVYPILGKLEDMARQVQNAEGKISETVLFAQMISDLWTDDVFEDEILPFVFQGCSPEYLEELEVPDIIAPFMKGVRYLATQENTPELAEALKKSEAGAEAA